MRLVATLLRALRLPAALLAIASAPAADNNLVGRPVPIQDGGLQLSVSTNSYRVYGGDLFTTAAKTARIAKDASIPRASLIASVQLANRSGSDLTFTFPDDGAAARRFNFRVLNSAGDELWNSATEAAADATAVTSVTAVLKKRTKWSNTLQIPLKIADEWLTPGVYTLEASIAGEPKIGATTLFEVVLPPTPPPPPDPGTGTGIKGQVVRGPNIYVQLDGTTLSPAVMPMGVKASIRIVELFPPGIETFRAPFVYEGETAADGTFQIDTLPGRYSVTATAKDLIGGPLPPVAVADATPNTAVADVRPPGTVRVETTVKAGEYSVVQLYLGGGIIYQPPALDTGIKGTVLKPAVGDAVPLPAVGATVVVEEIRPVTVDPTPVTATTLDFAKMPALLIRPIFRWTGVTNESGQFTVNTPPGRFRVTAVVYSATPGPVLSNTVTELVVIGGNAVALKGTAEAAVTAGQFSQVEIKLAPPLIDLPKQLVYAVSEVQAAIVRTAAGTSLRVTAAGSVSTSGWTAPELRQKRVTDGGVVEFEFLARPPSGISLQVISGISGSVIVPLPANAKSVRVISATNAKESGILIPVDPPILQAF